jgi:hypothetical protein
MGSRVGRPSFSVSGSGLAFRQPRREERERGETSLLVSGGEGGGGDQVGGGGGGVVGMVGGGGGGEDTCIPSIRQDNGKGTVGRTIYILYVCTYLNTQVGGGGKGELT